MNKVFSTTVLLILLTVSTSCAYFSTMEEREKMYGGNPPVISDFFASPELGPGGTWKVYLKASDPNGDMRYIVAYVDEAGLGGYSPSYTKIRAGESKELSGYVYLNTASGAGYTSRIYYDLALTVAIQDRAGHYSKPVSIPLHFDYRTAAQQNPPPGVFQERDLGPIMIELGTMTAENRIGKEE